MERFSTSILQIQSSIPIHSNRVTHEFSGSWHPKWRTNNQPASQPESVAEERIQQQFTRFPTQTEPFSLGAGASTQTLRSPAIPTRHRCSLPNSFQTNVSLLTLSLALLPSTHIRTHCEWHTHTPRNRVHNIYVCVCGNVLSSTNLCPISTTYCRAGVFAVDKYHSSRSRSSSSTTTHRLFVLLGVPFAIEAERRFPLRFVVSPPAAKRRKQRTQPAFESRICCNKHSGFAFEIHRLDWAYNPQWAEYWKSIRSLNARCAKPIDPYLTRQSNHIDGIYMMEDSGEFGRYVRWIFVVILIDLVRNSNANPCGDAQCIIWNVIPLRSMHPRSSACFFSRPPFGSALYVAIHCYV